MSLKTLGEAIRQEREKRGVSLRKFAERIKISAAFLVDIEKNRRLPGDDLLQRIADELDVPVSVFDEFSPDTPKQVKDWFEKHPLVTTVLNVLRKAPSPEEALARLDKASSPPRQRKFPLAIYESELQAIGLESAAWDTETGGDLFGIWGDIPVVYFASRAGPNAKRDHAHFRLDVDYLIRLSAVLQMDWGLRYFGDWHSHHRLGLEAPSGGDQRRIVNVARKNNFEEMAEFIVTFGAVGSSQQIVINPYAYLDLPSQTLTDVALIVLKGISPIRSALLARSALPEQQLETYSSFPTERLSIPTEALGRLQSDQGPSLAQISERVLSRAMSELTSIAAREVELYRQPFGFVVVVPVNDSQSVAFAMDKNWPHSLLQVDWIDRRSGRTVEIKSESADVSLLGTDELKKIFFETKQARGVTEK